MMNFVSETVEFVLKMMNRQAARCGIRGDHSARRVAGEK